MNKKILFLSAAISVLALGSAMAAQYTQLDINLNTQDMYSLKITPGAHTRVDFNNADSVDVSNHNYAHRAESTLNVIDNNGQNICTYKVSLMSGQEVATALKKYHNGLEVQSNPSHRCLAAGDNGQYSPGSVSTGTNNQGQSHINMKVVPATSLS